MKKLFFVSITGLILFEFAKVYFIMPMPGSQQINSIAIAYFLHNWRWHFRIFLGIMMIVGSIDLFKKKPVWGLATFLFLGVAVYLINSEMAADSMFYQPSDLQFKNVTQNKVEKKRLIIGVEINGQTRAYPIQFIGYHHQVKDTLGGRPIIVTYCTVCRTGRVFEPIVNGKLESFRLVGMDHFNAMFEDKTTGSWWRQANGEAIIGKLKGKSLPEIDITQCTLEKWLDLYPNSLIMQPDLKFKEEYDSLNNYETGKRKGKLTRRDTLSWKDKSWIVGINLNGISKAYDWNRLEKEQIINDVIDNQPICLVLANDNKSFFAFRRRDNTQHLIVKNDTLIDNEGFKYNIMGKSNKIYIANLIKINAYQEYWHSWKTFHPDSKK